MTVAGGEHEAALLDYVRSLRFDDLSAYAVEAVLALILDHFTCCLLGLGMPWTQTVRSVVAGPARPAMEAPEPGRGAWIYGETRPVATEVAALVNGTAAHGFDLDDLHFATMSHPGCVVIPAAVAAAVSAGADGHSLLTAVAAGYESMLRPGLAAGLGYGELGWHATGVLGPLGSAAAAARLLGGGSASATVDAIGLAASFGAGIKAFNACGPGMVKRLHAGRAAEAGIVAARLALAGFAGPRYALSSRFGLANVLALGNGADIAALDRDLGSRSAVEDIYIKPYAACGAVHGAVQAAERLSSDRPRLREEQITSVVVGTSPRALKQNSNAEPVDAMAAQYSTEVSVAIALLGGAGKPQRFLEVAADPHDPARRLARKVRLEVDERARASYPDPNEGAVMVTLKGGEVLRKRGSSSPSASRGWKVAEAKCRAVTATLIAGDVQERLLAAVRALADDAPAVDCVSAVSGELAASR